MSGVSRGPAPEGDLRNAVEGFGAGADADAGELEAVQEEGEFGAGAEALVDQVSRSGRNEAQHAFGGIGEALASAFLVGRVEETRCDVALIVRVAALELFGALVEFPELPRGGRAFEPGHARKGEGCRAAGHDDF